MTTQYRFVGSHAEEIAVGDKRVPVGPGDFVNLSDDDLKQEGNAVLIESNTLVTTESLAGEAPAKVPSGGNK